MKYSRCEKCRYYHWDKDSCPKHNAKRKHVRFVLDLEVGEQVIVTGWGPALDNKNAIITHIKEDKFCGSGFMVKLNIYKNWIDSDWLEKKV